MGREGHSSPGARPPGPRVSEIPAQSYGAAPGPPLRLVLPPCSLALPMSGQMLPGRCADFCPHPSVSSYPDRKDPQQFLSPAQAPQTCPVHMWLAAGEHGEGG